MCRKKILIFPAGTEIAFEIFNALKYSKFVELFGGTSANDHSEFVYKNLIRNFPYVDSPDFIEYLNNVIEKYDIDAVYPAHDSASVVLSENAGKIKAKVIISEAKTTTLCRSKKDTYKYFAGESFIPEFYESANDVPQFPVFVKPSVGQGSNGAEKIDTMEELKIHLNNDPSLVICEYLPGMEYTVDCFTDRHGTLRVVKLRNRERIRCGISVRSKLLDTDKDVLSIANKINNKLKFRGAWFFQLKKDINGEYKLMEISPRIPGTMGLSRNCGINFPMLTLFDFWGYDVSVIDNNYPLILDRAYYNAYKIDIKYEHVYVDYDDTLIINGAVNKKIIAFLYQAVEKGKKIHILSKHKGNFFDDLKKYKICKNLFDEIIIIPVDKDKKDFIREKPSIFIDDSFAERKAVSESLHIPVFDLDMVESLIEWQI